jgi:hypothetical protein
LLKELASGIKMKNTGEVEDNDGGATIFDVRGDEGMEPLLASSVPELHSESFIIDIDGFGDEINSNCRLNDD